MWRRTIWDEMRRMQEEINAMLSMFDRRFWDVEPLLLPEKVGDSSHPVEASIYRQPLADIFETDKEIVATMELPGVEKKDIEINVDNGVLEVKVEKKEEKKEEEKKKGLYRLERSYAGFYRSFRIPENVDADKITATYKNGVLELRIPKKSEKKKKGKKIEVK